MITQVIPRLTPPRSGRVTAQREGFSWIIPIIPKDCFNLVDLVRAIEGQTIPPDEIIVVASGFSGVDLALLKNRLGRSSANFRLFSRRFMRSAGQNRKLGVRNALFDWVTFFDADDLPSLDRQSVLWDVRKWLQPGQSDKVVVLHSFEKIARDEVSKQFSQIARAEHQGPRVYSHIYSELSTRTREKLAGSGGAKASVVNAHFRFQGSMMPVHHAAIAASKNLLERFPPESRKVSRDEDVRLLNRIWRAGGVDFYFVGLPLMTYRVSFTNGQDRDEELEVNPFRHLVIATRKIAQFKKATRRFSRRVKRFVVG